jgi:hypothetical protein
MAAHATVAHAAVSVTREQEHPEGPAGTAFKNHHFQEVEHA